jgi:hypothetical protein
MGLGLFESLGGIHRSPFFFDSEEVLGFGATRAKTEGQYVGKPVKSS